MERRVTDLTKEEIIAKLESIINQSKGNPYQRLQPCYTELDTTYVYDTSGIEKAAADEEASSPVMGRPRTAQDKAPFTVKPKKETIRRIKQYALDHNCNSSDVIDALVERYLGELDANRILELRL